MSIHKSLIGDMVMKPGDLLTTARPIRSRKTGIVLPRQGTFVSAIENLGRRLILVNFGKVGPEYLFPDEIVAQGSGLTETPAVPNSHFAMNGRYDLVVSRRILRTHFRNKIVADEIEVPS